MSLTASYNTKNKLIDILEKDGTLVTLDKGGVISKFFNKKYAQVYFHSGSLDSKAKEKIINSQKTIVNSKEVQHNILKELELEENRVSVLYPSVNIQDMKKKEVKQLFCEKHNLNKKNKIILFTAKNFKMGGVKEFVEIILSLNLPNYHAIIAGDKKQITSLKFALSKINIENRFLLLEDYADFNELYYASDIFLLPSSTKGFSLSVLKAMYCKNAVFTTVSNYASELIDVFSTLESSDDRSTIFKIEALLSNKDELKTIQKQNRKFAKEFTINKNLDRLRELLKSI